MEHKQEALATLNRMLIDATDCISALQYAGDDQVLQLEAVKIKRRIVDLLNDIHAQDFEG